MKTSYLLTPRRWLILLGALGLACSLRAQSANANGHANPGADSRPSIPSVEKLDLMGQVTNAAEAKPLIAQYYAEEERFFQERRAAILQMQGKTPEEQLKIMQAVVASQHDRRQKHRELEARVEAMLKQDREDHLVQETPPGKGK